MFFRRPDRRAWLLVLIATYALPQAKDDPANALRELQSLDPDTTLAGRESIKRLGPRAAPIVPAIVEMLKWPNPYSRANAALALGEIGDPAQSAVPTIIQLLNDPNTDIRGTAAEALGAIGPAARDAVPALTNQLLTDHENRDSAAAALGDIGPAAAAAVPALIEEMCLDDKSGTQLQYQVSALPALGRIGPVAVAALTQTMKEAKCFDVEAPLKALTKSGPAGVSALIDGLKIPDRDTRYFSAYYLGEIGPDAKAAVPALVKLLKDLNKDSDDPVEHMRSMALQSAAVHSLGQIGPDAKGAIPDLAKMLNDTGTEKPREVVDALGSIGKPAIAALIEALNNRNQDIRSEASNALGSLHGAASPAVPALIKVLKSDHHDEVRRDAASALGEIGTAGRPAIPTLIESLGGTDERITEEGANALVKISVALQDSGAVNAVNELEWAERRLTELSLNEQAADIGRTVSYLRLRRRSWASRVSSWAAANRWRTGVLLLFPLYVLWFGFLRFVLLRRAPLRLLAWNEALAEQDTALNIEFALGGAKIKIPIKALLKTVTMIGFYRFHSLVLAGWIENHIEIARSAFEFLPTARNRRTFVSLPIVINGNSRSSLTPLDLHPTTSRDRWCLLVKGEGGLGKTTLACHLAFWAMSKDPKDRLCADRRMLPLLLEPGIKFDVRSDVSTFRRELLGHLQQLVGTKRADFRSALRGAFTGSPHISHLGWLIRNARRISQPN